ncbi:hypothetical protein C6P92_07850 [Burkholderia multivorans]|nr:hypothetical protein C6P92_07850 [Burkholderia multivorans]
MRRPRRSRSARTSSSASIRALTSPASPIGGSVSESPSGPTSTQRDPAIVRVRDTIAACVERIVRP